MRYAAAIGVLIAASVHAQPAQQRLEFEVASVRPSEPLQRDGITVIGLRGGPETTDPGRMSGKIDLRNALLRAFGVEYDRLSGPDWMQMERYDFTAVVPPGTTKEQFNVMLQNLLIDRFKITMHYVKKDFEVYEMTVAKGGLKMKPSTAVPNPVPAVAPAQADSRAVQAQAETMLAQLRANVGKANVVDADGFPALQEGNTPALRGVTVNGRQMINARGQSMSGIVRTMQSGLGSGARVVDKTGLTGLYDFKLQYARSVSVAPAAGGTAGAEAEEPAPDLASAAQSQLGLKLDKGKAQFEVLVIDHIEKTPIDN
jgi:uncharacterized protein (TIGR03435 family)